MLRYPLTLTLALILTVSASAQFSENVMPNGSFEEGLAGWTASVNDAQNLGAQITEDREQAKHGTVSARLSLPKGPTGAGLRSPRAPVRPGEDYLLTFHFRSEGFSDTNLFAGVNLQFVLAWLDAEGQPVAGPGGAGLAYGAVPEWRFISKLYRAPAGAAFLTVSFNMSCDENGRPSRAWFDRVQLRPWPAGTGEPVRRWVYPVADGFYTRDQFRRVADDDTPTGFAVIANPKFMTKPGYLAGGIYLRTLEPGEYRAIYRLKLGAVPEEPAPLFSWDINTGGIGALNSGTISTADFVEPGVYLDFPFRFVLPPGAQFVDPRLHWSGAALVSVDTLTIVQDRAYAPEDLQALLD